MKRALLFLGILLPAIALLTYGLSRDPRELPSALIDKPAPAFDLPTLDGERITLASLSGTPVVLNFWSTWCSTCSAEHALLQEANEIYGIRGVQFFSVLYEDTVENVRLFLSRHGSGVPILLDPLLRTAIDYGVAGVPETYFIDRNGIIVYKQSGMLTAEVIERYLEPLAEGP